MQHLYVGSLHALVLPVTSKNCETSDIRRHGARQVCMILRMILIIIIIFIIIFGDNVVVHIQLFRTATWGSARICAQTM